MTRPANPINPEGRRRLLDHIRVSRAMYIELRMPGAEERFIEAELLLRAHLEAAGD